MLKFDAATAQVLGEAYLGADITARRRVSFDALAPSPGDHVLDLGCGNGLMALELSRAVGPAGRVTGLDPSADMLASARALCAHRVNIEVIEGVAEALPLEDASVDKAVALQVFEYFDDMGPPLDELRRVLKPGARAVIGDQQWDTLSWYSAAPDRMARMIADWDAHLAERAVPQILPSRLPAHGFAFERLVPLVFVDTELKPDGIANMMIHLMCGFAKERGEVPAEEIDAWAEEQRALAAEGRFFFTMTHFACVARAV